MWTAVADILRVNASCVQLSFGMAMVTCLLSNIRWNLKGDLMMCVFPELPSLSDDAERCHSWYQISARFIWLEFFYFWAAEYFFTKKEKKNSFHLFSFPPLPAVGVVIMEHCWVAADNCLVLWPQMYKLFPLLPKGDTTRSDHKTEPHSSLVGRGNIGQPEFDLQFFLEEKVQSNIPVCGMMLPVMKHWGMRHM